MKLSLLIVVKGLAFVTHVRLKEQNIPRLPKALPAVMVIVAVNPSLKPS